MRKLIFSLILAFLILAGNMPSYAQISSAAVLFLRIAAGARAAGMGDAYVAIADDATATHWNPAGLGQYPLNSKWFEIDIPENLQPLKKIALYKGEGATGDQRDYDIWAISPEGLVRLSKSEWQKGDVISPRGDQTLESVLREYTGLTGVVADVKIPMLADEVSRINNKRKHDAIDSLKDVVMNHLQSDYSDKAGLDSAFVALNEGYKNLHIDWPKFDEAVEMAKRAMRDSVFSETEADRMLFILEKASWRYLPPRITIPFDINFTGKVNDLGSDDKYLWIGTDSGLFRYDDGNWRKFGLNEGMPSLVVKKIKVFDKKVALFTDSGLVVYDKGAFTTYEKLGLPKGNVQAIYLDKDDKGWAVIDNDLFRFDGVSWKNYIEFADTTSRTPEEYYDLMAIYNFEDEKASFIEKFDQLNEKNDEAGESTGTETDSTAVDEMEAAQADSAMVGDSTEVPETPGDVSKKIDDVQAEAGTGKSMGGKVKIPFTAGFQFKINDLGVDEYGTLWVATNYGLLNFNGRKWRWLGYKDYINNEEDVSVYDIALNRVNGDSTKAGRLADIIKKANKLDSDIVPAGTKLNIYSNPAGSRIHGIDVMGSRVYFATSSGTIFFDGIWNRLNEQDLGRRYAGQVVSKGGTLFILTKDKIEFKSAAKGQLTMMHVNWLPELADDIYYEFIGYVKNVEGWGTVGGNVTFLTYGSIQRTDPNGNSLGTFTAYDVAVTLSYGSSITEKLSGGISAKVIYSHLSEIGAGREQGKGTSTGLAIDLGLLYRINPKLSLGVALTNLGPEISYIDVSQADPLPRNLAVGVAWKMIQSSYNELLFTVEANKSLAERDRTILEDFRDIIATPVTELKSLLFNPLSIGAWSKDFEDVIINGGFEYKYGSFIAFRAGYVYDEVGDVKTPTLGVGLAVRDLKFDFAYIPSNDNVPLANTMRFSLSAGW